MPWSSFDVMNYVTVKLFIIRVELCACASERGRSTRAGEACTSDRQSVNGNPDSDSYSHSCLCERIAVVCVCVVQVVSVTFDELSLERHTTCVYDSVSLYDGSSNNSPSLGTFCTVATTTITSSGSALFVVFRTDGSVRTGSFALNWKFLSQGWFTVNVRWPTRSVVQISTINYLW